MNALVWVLQIVLRAYFGFVRVKRFIVPPGRPASMAWMYDLSPGLHYFSGSAEILAALGLILPRGTHIQPHLTHQAALGLVLAMLGAAAWHVGRGETTRILLTSVLALLAGFVAYGRWRLKPLSARQAVQVGRGVRGAGLRLRCGLAPSQGGAGMAPS